MNDVSRDEFNGLGARVNGLNTDFVSCRGSRGIEILNLREDVDEGKKHIETLYTLNRDELRRQSKIMGAGVAIISVIQIVGVLVMVFFKFKGG